MKQEKTIDLLAKKANISKHILKCDKCNNESIISLEYGPHNFCKNHFNKFFKARFKKTIRKYSLFKSKEKLLIAVSGGKDSILALNLLHEFYSKSNPMQVLIVDEGVNGYRNNAIKLTIDTCKKFKIKCNVISFREKFNITNDELMPILLNNPKLGGTCAFCGTIRRNIMNSFAKEINADKIVTGHNLDDEVQSFVMNVFNNEIDRIIKSSVQQKKVKNISFVKRIKPLYETPEKEIIAYCEFNKIKHYSQDGCPYSWTAKRNEYRKMLNQFEIKFPGTGHSILRFNENLNKILKNNENEINIFNKKIKECKICDEPTQKEFCKTCEMIQKIKNEKTKLEKIV
ncbi:MAG: TIGR00269 family protein [Candidatus ainarchaeum sp.]|nr:TIGR00269 family protein [Candidatus ainarchaeum sp.]